MKIIVILFLLTPYGWWLVPGVAATQFRRKMLLRRRRAMMVLGYLDQAIRLNLPLLAFLDAAERGEDGPLAARLGRFRLHLESGVPIARALEHAVPETPPRSRSLLDAAEKLGRLPQALRYLIGRDEADMRDQRVDASTVWGYAVTLLIAGVGIGLAITIFIVPNFERIFDDFGSELPKTTALLFYFSAWLQGDLRWGQTPGTVWIALVGSLIFALVLFGRLTAPGRWLFGCAAWLLPVTHGLVRDRDMADVCSLVASAAEAGMPMHQAVREAGAMRLNPAMQVRMRHWAEAMQTGQPPAAAADRARLPKVAVALMATAEQADRLSNVLQFLSRHYAARYEQRCRWLQSLIYPAVTVAVAVPIGWIVVGLFLPLVELIDQVSMQTGFY